MKKNNSNHDFLSTWDKDIKFIEKTIQLAQELREKYYKGQSVKAFDAGLAVSIFKDKSTRTRYSYAAAASMLGLSFSDFDEGKSQIGHGETVMETANMISFVTKAIGIRDDIYLGVGHKYMQEVGKYLDWGHQNGVLPIRPSIINLQSDQDHPSQSLSDLSHLVNYFGGLKKLKGKKITVSWAYSPSYGKPMSVPQGVIALLSRFGMDITLAYPKEYHLISKIEKYAALQAKKSHGQFKISHSMKDTFVGADIVYPKSWASYEVMEKRTALLKTGSESDLKKLEQEALKQNAKYKDWICTEKLMEITNKGKALYMHCLPADISGVSCKEGEVEADVFEKYKKELCLQASYKPFIIASMILISQFGSGATVKLGS